MKSQRLMIALTVVNLGILLFQLSQIRRVEANNAATQVLRGRELELVDDHGRVRVQMKVFPANPTAKMPDGTTGYPEAVQLRLISSQGAPNVKIVATEDGSGLVLGGGSSSYVQALARGGNPFIKVVDKNGQQQIVKP